MKTKPSLKILVTGAGKGIGRATVLELVKEFPDAHLLITSRTLSDLELVKKEAHLLSKTAQISELALDLNQPETVQKLFESALKTLGQIDILIANAGVGRFGELESLTDEDLDFVMNTNVTGFFHLCQKIFLHMRQKKSGHLIAVTSVAAEKPFEQSAIYCMSKYAQKGLLDVLRLHAKKCGVRITEIQPGAVHTPMWGNIPHEMAEQMMQASDIAQAITACVKLPERASAEKIVIRPITGDL